VRSLADAFLYAMIDLGYASAENAPAILEKLVAGGIDIVQLRGKNRSLDELSVLAEQLLQLTMSAKIPFIANDHAEMARRVEVKMTIQSKKCGRRSNDQSSSANQLTALNKLSPPSAKGRITSASAQSSPLPPNPITRLLVSRTFAKFTSEFPFPFFASAESNRKISRK
jgi:hypothetical protein